MQNSKNTQSSFSPSLDLTQDIDSQFDPELESPISDVDVSDYSDYIDHVTPSEDLDRYRALNQGAGQQAINAVGQAVAKGALGCR